MEIELSASILAANLARLEQEVIDVTAAGIDSIHFDVMDHHFVPNLSFGPAICHSLRQCGINVSINVHLMVTTPADYIKPFAQAGANMLIFHPETVEDVPSIVAQIKASGMQAGLAFNPDRPVQISQDLLTTIDLILLMSVVPGFGGQSFIESSYHKINMTRRLIDQNNRAIQLGIDGGVKLNNVAAIVAAGADFLVVGSGLFDEADYVKQVQAFKNAI